MATGKIILRPIFDSKDKIPVHLGNISPNSFAGKSLEKIGKMKIWHGNRQISFTKVFEISGKVGKTPEETTIEVNGSIPLMRHFGENMSAGIIHIKGDAGMHLGARMTGGVITVQGNVDHWLGAEMSGGAISIQGNVGDKAASAYLGSKYGMNGGSLYIKGNAGHELGMGMRRGVIVVEGDTKAYTGTRMLAGTIIVRGQLGDRAGASMWYKGTILALGEAKKLLPTHLFNGEYESMLVIKLLMDAIEKEIPTVTFSPQERKGPYLRFTGDFGSGGRGEILLFKPKNKAHLEGHNNGDSS